MKVIPPDPVQRMLRTARLGAEGAREFDAMTRELTRILLERNGNRRLQLNYADEVRRRTMEYRAEDLRRGR